MPDQYKNKSRRKLDCDVHHFLVKLSIHNNSGKGCAAIAESKALVDNPGMPIYLGTKHV